MAQLLCNEEFIKSKLPYSTEELIDFTIKNDLPGKVFFIFPTGKIVRRVKQQILQTYFQIYTKPIEPLNVFTLQTFIKLIHKKSFNQTQYSIISDSYRLAIFEEAIAKTDLMFYKKHNDKMSYAVLQRLANVIFGLKEDGITPEIMKKRLSNYLVNNDGTLDVLKYGDITNLFAKYEEIKGTQILDNEDIINQVNNFYKVNITDQNELFTSSSVNLSNIFSKDTIIHFDSFSEFKFPETKFLSLFANSEIPVSLRIDYLLNEKKNIENWTLFGNLEKTIIDLSDSGFRLIPLDVFTQNQKERLEDVLQSFYLRRWLFNTERRIENSNFSNIVKIFEFENIIDEVKTLAKLIKWLVIEKNYKISDICIVMRQPENYTTLFREIFQEFKIPVNISDRYKLSSSNVVNSIFGVLDLVINKFRREDVNKILNSHYISLESNDKPDSRINSTRLYDVALQLRINGGKKSGGKEVWIKKMELRLKSLQNQLQIADGGNEEQIDKYSLLNEIKQIAEALKDFDSLQKLISFDDKMIYPDEFFSIVKNNVINSLDILKNIYNIYRLQSGNFNEKSINEKILYAESVEKDVRALTEFEKILREFVDILNDRNPNTKFSLGELTEKLRTSMLSGKYQVREKQGYGVTITSIEQIRNINFKVGILCGAIDGSFPISYRPEVFLGEEIPDTELRHICSERMQFYQFLTNSSEELDRGEKEIYITYPQFHEEQELIRSPFVDALLRITNLEDDNKIYNFSKLRKSIELSSLEVDPKLLMQLPEVPFINAVASENEKYQYFGQKILEKNNFDEIISTFNIISPANLKAINFLRTSLSQSTTYSGLDWNLIDKTITEEFSKIQNKVYSITELETYNKCPYMFFLNYLVRLPQKTELEYGLSALESGNLFHVILYRFYNKLRQAFIESRSLNVYKSEQGLPPITCIEIIQSNHSNYLHELTSLAIEELDKIRFEHPYFEYQENELLGTKDKMGWLEIWLKCEYDRRTNEKLKLEAFKPIMFETGFGLKSGTSDNNVSPIEITHGLKIRGKIDRIEWDEENSFVVADYKSSAFGLPTMSKIIAGNSFQIPFYMISAKQILSEYYGIDAEPSAGAYYILKPKYNSNNKKFDSDKIIRGNNKITLDSILENSIEYAVEIVENIKKGNFPVEPKKELKPCEYCTFSNICHISKLNYF